MRDRERERRGGGRGERTREGGCFSLPPHPPHTPTRPLSSPLFSLPPLPSPPQLVDDDLVCQDRIGISNFLWSFPAAAGARAAAAADAAEAALAAARARTAELESALAAASAGKASGPDRDAALACLVVAEGLVSEAKAGLEAAAAGDPAKLAALAEAAAEARAAANRWLDNVHALKAWCGSKFGEGRGADLDAFFEAQGLTEAVDYL